MDTSQSNEKLLQAFTLLFKACEPLTHDCILSDEEEIKHREKITHHTFYCAHVKGAIEDGIEPLSFQEWDEKAKNFSVSTTVSVTDQDTKEYDDTYLGRATKLAYMMLERGVISSEQVEDHIEEFLEFDDIKFQSLKSLIEDIPIKNHDTESVTKQLNESFNRKIY